VASIFLVIGRERPLQAPLFHLFGNSPNHWHSAWRRRL